MATLIVFLPLVSVVFSIVVLDFVVVSMIVDCDFVVSMTIVLFSLLYVVSSLSVHPTTQTFYK
jgi:hypothetical protein